MTRLAQFLADLKCAAGLILLMCIPGLLLVEVTAVAWVDGGEPMTIAWHAKRSNVNRRCAE